MTIRGYRWTADWSRRGDLTGTLEDLTAPGPGLVRKDTPIVVTWGRDEPRATADASAGKLTGAVNNHGRQFSSLNAASPIAGKVLPGTPVALTLDVGGAITTLFAGPMGVPQVDPATKTLSVECSDGMGRPGQEQLSTPVYQGLRTGDLMNVVLDAIGWTGGRAIDPGATAVPYWWVDGQDAQTALTDLAHSEGPPALWFVQGGTFYFHDRHHRLTAAQSTTSQATYTHIIPAGGTGAGLKILKGSVTYDDGLDNIVNSATIEVTPRIPQNVQVVWKTDDPISLAPGEVRTLVVRTDDPFILAQAPNPLISYLDDGTYTYDYRLTSGAVTMTISRDSGQSLYLTMTGDPTLGAFIDTGLKLRAVPLTQGATYKYAAEDPSSVNTFGRNVWDGTAPWAYLYDADVISQRVVAVNAQARPSITLSIAGVDPAHMTEIAARTVGHRVTVREDELGLNADFLVERVQHSIRQLLNPLHQMEIGCQVVELQQPANVFTFDTSGRGFDDGAFGTLGVSNPGSMFTFDASGKGFDQGVFAA